MMQTSNLVLGALLAGQLAVLGLQHLPGDGVAGSRRTPVLPALSADTVTRLTIDDGEAAVTLTRSDDTWTVPSAHGYPADADKVSALVRQLASLEAVDVVSTTDHHHRSLEVAGDTFQRKLTIGGGDAEAHTLFVGTAARAGTTHVRAEGGDTVVAVRDLSAWRLSPRPESWLDPVVFEAPADTVVRLDLRSGPGSHTALRGPDGWTVGDRSVDAAIEPVLEDLERITLAEVVGRKDALDPDQTITLSVGLGAVPAGDAADAADADEAAETPLAPTVDTTVELSLAPKPGDEARTLLWRSDRAHVVEVRTSEVSGIWGLALDEAG